MITKSPPFRSANHKDPYFRRLSAPDKKAFWKIFSAMPISEIAKDLFERLTERDPRARISISDIKSHPWIQGEILDEESLTEDLESRSQIIQKLMSEALATSISER